MAENIDPVVSAALIGGVAGLLSGIVGSLFTPWVHWFIEKRRLNYGRKIELINKARETIDKSNTILEIESSSIWGFIRSIMTHEEIKNATSPFIDHYKSNKSDDDTFIRKGIISNPLSKYENSI